MKKSLIELEIVSQSIDETCTHNNNLITSQFKFHEEERTKLREFYELKLKILNEIKEGLITIIQRSLTFFENHDLLIKTKFNDLATTIKESGKCLDFKILEAVQNLLIILLQEN